MTFTLNSGQVISFDGKLSEATSIAIGKYEMTYGQMQKFMPDEAIELWSKANA